MADLTDISDTQQDSLDNIPEQLQEGDVGSMLQERIDNIADVCNELSSIDVDSCLVDREDDEEDEDFEEREHDAFIEEVDNILGGLEY